MSSSQERMKPGRPGRALAWLTAIAPVLMVPIQPCNFMPSRNPGTGGDERLEPDKREVTQGRVTTPSPPKGPLRPAMFPEAVIVRALDAVQGSFMRCYARARDEDPSLGSVRVMLHLEISEIGTIMRASADAPQPRFASCIAMVARGMSFPTAGSQTKLDLPLFFKR
jgi:hypothetical protein